MIVQGTKEWLEWRRQGIGASDANVIMGMSKHTTLIDLYNQKVGIETKKPNAFITNKGHDIEKKARAHFELLTFKEYPPKLAQHAGHPFLKASLDGCNDQDQEVLEIKYCGEEDFQKVLKGDFLEQYYPQLQHQMMVTGYKKAILLVATEEKDLEGKQIKGEYKFAHAEFPVNEDYIKKMYEKELYFWNENVLKKSPPSASKDDVICLTQKDGGIYDSMELYSDKLKAIKNLENIISEICKKEIEKKNKLEKELKDLKEELIKNKIHSKMQAHGILFNETEVSGSIDYKLAFEAVSSAYEEAVIFLLDEYLEDTNKKETAKFAVKKLKETVNIEKFRKPTSYRHKIDFISNKEEPMKKEVKKVVKKVVKKSKKASKKK